MSFMSHFSKGAKVGGFREQNRSSFPSSIDAPYAMVSSNCISMGFSGLENLHVEMERGLWNLKSL